MTGKESDLLIQVTA